MQLAPRSLRARLLWVTLAPALIALIALIALGFFAARATLEEEIGERLQASAAATAVLLPSGLIARYQPSSARTHANLQARLRKVAEGMGVRRVFLISAEGISLVDSRADGPTPGAPDRDVAADRFEVQQAADGGTAASVLYFTHEGVPYKRGFAPVKHEGAVVAIVGVEGSVNTYVGLAQLRTYMLLVGFLALLMMTLTAVAFSRALSAPLRQLAAAATRIGDGDLDRPVALVHGAAELEVLARTMEVMRSHLRQRDRELQMMLGGIAHEVRNPLGGMELFVGLLKEDLYERPDELELLSRVELELGNLKRVVEEFLEFARQQPVSKEPVSVSELIFEISMLVTVDLKCTAGEDAVFWGDAPRLRRLLLNLVRNAGQAGAQTVTLSQTSPAEWCIADDGPGLDTDTAARAFDAFFTTKEKGTGLGLALCRRIAEAHGGSLELSPDGPGARFLLRLPADAV